MSQKIAPSRPLQHVSSSLELEAHWIPCTCRPNIVQKCSFHTVTRADRADHQITCDMPECALSPPLGWERKVSKLIAATHILFRIHMCLRTATSSARQVSRSLVQAPAHSIAPPTLVTKRRWSDLPQSACVRSTTLLFTSTLCCVLFDFFKRPHQDFCMSGALAALAAGPLPSLHRSTTGRCAVSKTTLAIGAAP